MAGTGLVFLLSLAGSFYFDLYWLAGIPFVLVLFLLGWLEPRSIFYLLIFTLPFSTEVFFENGFATDFPDEALMWMMSVLVIAFWVFNKPLNLTTPQPLHLFLFIWILWIIITSFISPDPFLSFKYLLAKCWYIAAFTLPFQIWRDERIVKKTMTILLTAILFSTSIVLWQHSANGFSFATVNEAVAPFFRNHVNYSAMLVCSLPMIHFLYGETRSSSLRWFLSLLGLMVIIALYFAYARGAWVALVAAVAAYYLLRIRLLVFAFVAAIILILGSIAWLKQEDRFLQFAPRFQTTIFHEDFREHLVATYQLKDISTAERFHRWVAGVNLVADQAVGGVGPNRFYEEYKPYAIPAFKTWVSDNPERSGVHNYYLLLAIEQGIPGLIFFLLLAGAMLFHSQRIYHRASSETGRRLGMMLGMMLTMILTLNFLSDLIETDKIGSLFFICLGILVSLKTKET